MLLQTNSYIVPKDKRVEHTRLVRRFRQTLARLGCEQFEIYEQVGANWGNTERTGRYVQIMRFRDRKHQQAVQAAERVDPAAQQIIAEFCDLINFPYQQHQGLFAVGFYTSVLPVAPTRARIPSREMPAEEAHDEFHPEGDADGHGDGGAGLAAGMAVGAVAAGAYHEVDAFEEVSDAAEADVAEEPVDETGEAALDEQPVEDEAALAEPEDETASLLANEAAGEALAEAPAADAGEELESFEDEPLADAPPAAPPLEPAAEHHAEDLDFDAFEDLGELGEEEYAPPEAAVAAEPVAPEPLAAENDAAPEALALDDDALAIDGELPAAEQEGFELTQDDEAAGPTLWSAGAADEAVANDPDSMLDAGHGSMIEGDGESEVSALLEAPADEEDAGLEFEPLDLEPEAASVVAATADTSAAATEEESREGVEGELVFDDEAPLEPVAIAHPSTEDDLLPGDELAGEGLAFAPEDALEFAEETAAAPVAAPQAQAASDDAEEGDNLEALLEDLDFSLPSDRSNGEAFNDDEIDQALDEALKELNGPGPTAGQHRGTR